MVNSGVKLTTLVAWCCVSFACGPSDGSVRQDSSIPAVLVPSTTAEREIHIDSVRPTNPIVVYGRSRTFENTVNVIARDEAGRVITETFTTSVGEMGPKHNPYSAELWIVREPGSRVTVEAFEYSAENGSVRSLTDTLLPYGVERVAVTLHLPVGDSCTETRPFTRSIPKSLGLARLLMEALAAGANDAERSAGAASPFPKHSRVKGVALRDGVATVDFNERLQNVGGACAATAIRESVTRTLMALPSVKRVVITAGGSEALALQP